MSLLLVLADADAQTSAALLDELLALRACADTVQVRTVDAAEDLVDVAPDTRVHIHGARLGLGSVARALEARGVPYTVRILPGELNGGAFTGALRDLDDHARLVMPSRWHVRHALDRNVPPSRVFLLPPAVRVEALAATAPPPPTRLGRVAVLRGAADHAGRGVLERTLTLLRGHDGAPAIDEIPPDHAPSRRRDMLARADLVLSLEALGAPGSATDVLPLALVEAAALRRPIVSAALPALLDLVADGVNGLLFPPGDAHALASVLLRLARRPSELQRLGEAGPALAAAHDPSVFAARWRAEVWP
jgi:glycosyltransferase involved in cell wall biosynthesis